MTLYKSQAEKERDIVLVNSTLVFSIGPNGKAVPPTKFERVVFKEDQAAARVRLAIDGSMKVRED